MNSRRPGVLPALWLLLAIVLLVPPPAIAQTETGRISGTAMDEQGGVLPGATITATNLGTGGARSTTTDAEGRYAFPAGVTPLSHSFLRSGGTGFDDLIALGLSDNQLNLRDPVIRCPAARSSRAARTARSALGIRVRLD